MKQWRQHGSKGWADRSTLLRRGAFPLAAVPHLRGRSPPRSFLPSLVAVDRATTRKSSGSHHRCQVERSEAQAHARSRPVAAARSRRLSRFSYGVARALFPAHSYPMAIAAAPTPTYWRPLRSATRRCEGRREREYRAARSDASMLQSPPLLPPHTSPPRPPARLLVPRPLPHAGAGRERGVGSAHHPFRSAPPRCSSSLFFRACPLRGYPLSRLRQPHLRATCQKGEVREE